MSWVTDLEDAACRSGFRRGYTEAGQDAKELLVREGLLQVANWLNQCLSKCHGKRFLRLESELKPRDQEVLDELAEAERAMPPPLTISDASDVELRAYQAEIAYRQAALWDLLKTLHMFMVFVTEGSNELARQFGRDLTPTDLARTGQEALRKFGFGEFRIE